jgi:hypothetical protein
VQPGQHPQPSHSKWSQTAEEVVPFLAARSAWLTLLIGCPEVLRRLDAWSQLEKKRPGHTCRNSAAVFPRAEQGVRCTSLVRHGNDSDRGAEDVGKDTCSEELQR